MKKKLLRKLLKSKLKYQSKKRILTIGLFEYYAKQRLLINFKKLYYSYKKLQQCKVVSLYYPLQYEIDSRPVIKWLWTKNVTVVLPKIIKNSKILQFYKFNKNMTVKKNIIGIKEPINNDLITPEAVIMPIIGFDLQGYRLGQGCGYYDATIFELKKKLNVISIGLSYNWQEVSTIYPNQWDTKLNAIATNKFYKFFNNKEY